MKVGLVEGWLLEVPVTRWQIIRVEVNFISTCRGFRGRFTKKIVVSPPTCPLSPPASDIRRDIIINETVEF